MQVWDSEFFRSLRASPAAMGAAIIVGVFLLSSVFAPWVAPHNPYDLATLDLLDSQLPPAWLKGGRWTYLFGTDDQGRDILSTIIYGSRVSLIVGFASVALSAVLGSLIGLATGYFGGWIEALAMRLADLQLTIPAILLALLINGVSHALLPRDLRSAVALYTLIFAIGIAHWPQFARVARASTLAEREKDYVQAARVTGVHPVSILLRHILPNISGPLMVLSTLGLAYAILSEASLSFLGVGTPATQPSLGTLIRIGNSYLFSGQWWMSLIPSLALLTLMLAVNLFGDWLKDAFNSKLR